ncbi:MAG: Uma2 family endonuclease [Acidimicrobiales bacterium]
MSEAIAFGDFESFLIGEQSSENRHEFVGLRTYVMAGGSERHDLMAGLIFAQLAPGALARGCRPFTANRLVRTGGDNSYYPDVMIACGPAAHRLYEQDASLIVEVLSPSTSAFDRREKAVAYAQLPSLTRLMLVDPDQRRVEVAAPGGGRILVWTAFGAGQCLAADFATIDIDALYDALDAAATTGAGLSTPDRD